MEDYYAITFDEYVVYADNLEQGLLSLYGPEKTARLFQKWTVEQFNAVLTRASEESLVRQWLRSVKEKLM